MRRCREQGITEITGSYIPTAKNGIVEGFYRSLGFESVGSEGNAARWRFAIPQEYINKTNAMEVIHEQG